MNQCVLVMWLLALKMQLAVNLFSAIHKGDNVSLNSFSLFASFSRNVTVAMKFDILGVK
jgi:hypothetical protein